MRISISFLDAMCCGFGAIFCLWLLTVGKSAGEGDLLSSPSTIFVKVKSASGSAQGTITAPSIAIRALLRTSDQGPLRLYAPAFGECKQVKLLPQSEDRQDYVVMLVGTKFADGDSLVISLSDFTDHSWSFEDVNVGIDVQVIGQRDLARREFYLSKHKPRLDLHLAKITSPKGFNKWEEEDFAFR